MENKVITRIPPSPTGHLHIGTARTALFNYLYAKHEGGEMLFRSEDTDRERSKLEFETEIIDGLLWLGIEIDTENIIRQSERIDLYKNYLNQMLESGAAYQSEEESKRNPGETINVIRLKNPNTEIRFDDVIRGEIKFDTTELGDIVIARSLEEPLYHLTVVVDDYESGVTHVLRGEDHISNTSRQILIQEAIGAPRPIYGHLPLILAPDKSKMSKRHGAVSINEYREQGFLPEAIVNYLALLGWNPGTDKEIYTMSELVEAFNLSGVQKGGAVFDLDKFKWINKQHLQKLSDSEFKNYIESAIPDDFKNLPQYDTERVERLMPELRERIHTKAEAREAFGAGEYDFIAKAPELDLDVMKWKNDKKPEDALPRLEKLLEILPENEYESSDAVKEIVWPLAEELGKGELLWPFRVALTGLSKSPDPFTCAYILGPLETKSRIRSACDKLKG